MFKKVLFDDFESMLLQKLVQTLNALANRLANINGKIKLRWLNLSYESFKIKWKQIFLTKT